MGLANIGVPRSPSFKMIEGEEAAARLSVRSEVRLGSAVTSATVNLSRRAIKDMGTNILDEESTGNRAKRAV